MANATDKAAAQVAENDADEAIIPDDQEPQVEPGDETVAVEAEGEDERLGAGRAEEEAAEKKQKAAERRARKERQRLARERLQNENAQLRAQVAEHSQRLTELTNRVVKNDGDSIEQKLADVRQKLEMATTIQAKAARSQGPTAEQDYIEATKIRDQLLRAETALEQAKEWRAQNTERQAPPQRQTVDAEVVRQAREFAAENDWYAPQGAPGRNRESEIADRISAALDLEGELPPKSPEYWEEFRKRCRANKAIGHLMPEAEDDSAAEDEDEPAPRTQSKGPRMTAGGRERPLKRGEVYIPRELKENMQNAGIWDDPVRRDRVIKNYQAQQRAARAG